MKCCSWFSLLLIKVGWDWATLHWSFFFFTRFRFDLCISCKMYLLSQLYCDLIRAFYITLRHMADLCAIRPSKLLPFACRDWVIKLTKQPWRMRQQKLSLFYPIIFQPRLVSVYPSKTVVISSISFALRSKPTISLTFTASLSISQSLSLCYTQ